MTGRKWKRDETSKTTTLLFRRLPKQNSKTSYLNNNQNTTINNSNNANNIDVNKNFLLKPKENSSSKANKAIKASKPATATTLKSQLII